MEAAHPEDGRLAGWAIDRFGRWAVLAVGFCVVVSAHLSARWLQFPGIDRETSAVLLRAVVLSSITAYAAIEVFKRLTSIRGWFHRREIQRYLSSADQGLQQAVQGPSETGRSRSEANPDSAWMQLVDSLGRVWLGSAHLLKHDLYRGSNRKDFAIAHEQRDLRYFFALPLERLMGQLTASVEMAQLEPLQNSQLLVALGGTEVLSQLDKLEMARDPKRTRGEAERTDAQAEAVATINERVQRGLDSLQVIVGHRWRWFLRAMALAIASTIAVFLLDGLFDTRSLNYWFSWIVVSVLGGVAAWVVRDVVAVAERWRS